MIVNIVRSKTEAGKADGETTTGTTGTGLVALESDKQRELVQKLKETIDDEMPPNMNMLPLAHHEHVVRILKGLSKIIFKGEKFSLTVALEKVAEHFSEARNDLVLQIAEHSKTGKSTLSTAVVESTKAIIADEDLVAKLVSLECGTVRYLLRG